MGKGGREWGNVVSRACNRETWKVGKVGIMRMKETNGLRKERMEVEEKGWA